MTRLSSVVNEPLAIIYSISGPTHVALYRLTTEDNAQRKGVAYAAEDGGEMHIAFRYRLCSISLFSYLSLENSSASCSP